MRETQNGVIQIITNETEPSHVHSEAELIYVLEGTLDVFVENESYRAKPGDIVLFNSQEFHGWSAGSRPLICRVYIGYYSLKTAVGRQRVLFDCNSMKNAEIDYSRIRFVLKSILKVFVSETGNFKIKSLYYSLWEFLCAQFITDDQKSDENEDHTIGEIVQYLNEHYTEHLSQAQIAEKWYMSQSSFSRYFKEKTRIGFVEYVRGLRVNRAKEQLAHSNKSITEIALDTGFSSVALFNKNFKEETGKTPSAYRTALLQEEEDKSDNIHILKEYLQKNDLLDGNSEEVLQVNLDVENYRDDREHKIEGMSGMFVSDLLDGKVQEHISTIAEKLQLEYIQIFNPLDEAMKSYKKSEFGQCDFQALDDVLDFLLDHHLQAYFQLPRRRNKRLIAHIGGTLINEEETSLEFTVDEWKEVMEAFLQHLIDRYPSRSMQKWKYEIWKDPEDAKEKDRFQEIYEVTYRLIRRYFPKAKIGAYGLILDTIKDEEQVRSKLHLWKKKNMVPDFLTQVSYPYSVGQKQDGSYVLYHIQSDTHFIKKDIERYRKILQAAGYEDTELVISEWNTSLSQRNHYNDSCAKACHMLRQMIDMEELGVSHYYSNITDYTTLFYDSKGPLIGASGLMTRDGILKPAFFIMDFWNKLGNRVLGSGEYYTATSTYDESIQVLAYNVKEFNADYYIKDENQIFVKELNTMFKDKEILKQRFTFHHMKNKRYSIRVFRMKETEGSVLAEWGKLGNVEQLIREEIRYLKQMSTPRMNVMWKNAEKGLLNVDIELQPNEIALILIR